ncbi:ABC transporter ATP-binding protein [Corynebacterium humireducens NBRC 106098 = DSM 45392]|uniref:Trehalose import ATP-binding protein SugC n=1 Tax=Corynebacterium humireducens NBRC 106098 = DSM 45392 TaxID=1223515 RepID=A0A0B5D4M6_9CORY|nr:ABC transporter ATP-binding protein [Corynebacterium humireducens]AJE31902.1 ABC transporter ATP-binding protein [Corynebacterium humireducens NBRC 106098 = DSM 45392]
MSAIDIHDLTVTFPDGTVGLSGIELQVRPEEFIVLIGASGSGKTTLLRTLAGFLTPSAGHVAIGGRDVTAVPPEKRRMGMVFQQHAVWPHMSVARNVEYPLRRAGVGKRERGERVDRALELVGLGGFARRRPDSLSGGQRQRVALARAIVADPTVLLLDEALSALDEPLRDSLRRELVTLTRREGLTTVHVTHDRTEALAIADRVVVLGEGRIQQVATPQELVSRPATAEVAAFIADATLLDATALPVAPSEVMGSGSTLTLAVLPHMVEVLPAGADGIPAQVRSVLYDAGDWSLTLDALGTVFRATVRGARPEVGDPVTIRIHRPLGYLT